MSLRFFNSVRGYRLDETPEDSVYLSKLIEGPFMLLTGPVTREVSRRDVRHRFRIDSDDLDTTTVSASSIATAKQSVHTFLLCTSSADAMRGAIVSAL